MATLAAFALCLGLLLLALGYWLPWLPHPVAGLAILGVDLPEYAKFVPEVQSGHIPLDRHLFFRPLLALAGGLILLASVRRPALPLWLRSLLLVMAAPVSLAMLPPAWTPALLRAPEFRLQTLYIVALLAAVALAPLLHRWLPDSLRGLLLVGLAVLTFPALAAFHRLLPALEGLYQQPLQPGNAVVFTGLGALWLGLGGLILAGTGIADGGLRFQQRGETSNPAARYD